MKAITIEDVEDWIIDTHTELAEQRGKTFDQHIHDTIRERAVEYVETNSGE